MLFFSLFVIALILRLSIKALRERTLASAAAAAVCFLLAGAALGSLYSYTSYSVKLESETALAGKEAEVCATITDKISTGEHFGVYNARVHETDDYCEFNCRLTTYSPLEVGNTVMMKATFELPSVDGDFDERRYLLSDGITLTASAENIRIISESPESLASCARNISNTLRSIFMDELGEESGGFISALLLGNRSDISKSVKRDFSRLGISHILAISGMHLTVICTLAGAMLGAISQRLKKPGCILIVIFYMLITGFSASVVRSGIMLLFMIAASFFKRRSDSITNLCASVFIICITDPYATADIGLQLSFAAVMALLLFSTKRIDLRDNIKDKSSKLNSVKKVLLSPIATTLVVVLFLLPLEWLYFDEISLISPLTNPLFSILATLMLWLSPFIILCIPAPTFSAIIVRIVDRLVEITLLSSAALSDLRGITVGIGTPLTPVFCILIFGAVIAFCITKKKKRLVSGAILATFVLSFGISCALYRLPYSSTVAVSMESHKVSDAVVVASENKAMLIDIGNGYMPIMRKAMNSVKDEQITELEVLMLTHIHSSHPATVEKILESYKVRTVLLPNEDSPIKAELIGICRRNGTEVKTYEHGDAIVFGDITVKSNEPLFIKRSVQPIIHLSLTAYGEEFIYVGGGYSEAVPDADLTDADHIWFGTHGPLYKTKFTPRTSLACRIYVSEKNEEYIIADEKRPPQRILLVE